MAYDDYDSEPAVELGDLNELGDLLAEKAREHGEKYHNCFCWNCGAGVKIALPRPCPNCGAMMNGPNRFYSPCAPHNPGRASAMHPSIRRYKKNTIVYGFIFAIIVSIIVACVMFFSGDMEFDDEGIHHVALILEVLWLFWIISVIYTFVTTGKEIREAGRYNRSGAERQIYCAMCKTPAERNANYCGICGCIIPK